MSNSEAIRILEQARKLYERNPSHVESDQTPIAGSYCMVTALQLNDSQYDGSLESSPAYAALRDVAGGSLVEFNFAHTTEEVLAVFDQAIQSFQ